MAKETVILENEQWMQILNVLTSAPAPWAVTNPLIQALSTQIQAQRQAIAAKEGNSHDAGNINAQRSGTVIPDPTNPNLGN